MGDWTPMGASCVASSQPLPSGERCFKCAGVPNPSNPSCRLLGGLDMDPFGDDDCKRIAEGTFGSCNAVAQQSQGACTSTVAACKTGNCNMVSIWETPSCHTDVKPSYKFCNFYSCEPSFLANPDLDGHCDEAVGCQGTFFSLTTGQSRGGEEAVVATLPAIVANDWTPMGASCVASSQPLPSGEQCFKCAGVPNPSNPSCRLLVGLDMDPFWDDDCKRIAEGTFGSCNAVAQQYQGACTSTVDACKTGNCNVVSIWETPSCHTDVKPSYKFCNFYSCEPSFLANPDLDGHCDEAVGCQGTFFSLTTGQSRGGEEAVV